MCENKKSRTHDNEAITKNEIAPSAENASTKKKRKGTLVAINFRKDKIVIKSLDVEYGGNECSITQFSAVTFQLGSFKNYAPKKKDWEKKHSMSVRALLPQKVGI